MADRRPNLLFVFADQLRARELNDPRHPLLSPAWDRLCEEGTRCTNMVANCPVCTPSRAMLMTGQYPQTNRVVANDLPLPEDAVTIGDLTRAVGYRTGYLGKWHIDGIPRTQWTPPGPRRHGFETWAVHNCIHNYLRSSYYTDSPEPLPIPGYEPEFQTDLALDFLATESDDPFCLFLSWGPPHAPYDQLPPWFARLYDPARLDLPGNFRDPDRSLLAPGANPNAVGFGLPPAETLAHYYGAITALDQQLMRLLNALDRNGQADNTIVVYTSDHGDMLFSHGRMKKQQPWDESVQVPLAIRWPGEIPAGRDFEGCVSIVDLAPTLLEMMGCEVPAAMQGSALAGPLRGGTGPVPESSLIMDVVPVDQGPVLGIREWRGVRTRRHTYARWQDGTCWVLYDNLADPDQLCNLATAPEYAGLRASLEAELQGWLQRADDPFLSGPETLRRLGLVDLWNARERDLHGDRAVLLEP